MGVWHVSSDSSVGRGLTLLCAAVVLLCMPLAVPASAQNPQLQQTVAEIRQLIAANRQSLSHYAWLQQQTILVSGEVKKVQLYQVHLGPDGKPQRVLTASSATPTPIGPLRRHIAEKMSAEYEQYAQQIAALGQTYTQSDPQLLQQAYQRGHVTYGPNGLPGEVRLIIVSYIKPNDSATIVVNRAQRALVSLHISSYLSDPSDAVGISAQFGKLADGTNHVSALLVNGVSKQLTVDLQNSDYTRQ
jgi:hypothetical protein